MEYHKTINEILKLLDTQIEIVKVGDLLETYKTQFIIKKNNYVIKGIKMTVPPASLSRATRLASPSWMA